MSKTKTEMDIRKRTKKIYFKENKIRGAQQAMIKINTGNLANILWC